MASNPIKALESGICQLIKPEMMRHGFAYEDSTRTFRRRSGECTQLVDFPVGVRTMAGQFTANVAVFHPVYRDPGSQELVLDQPREFHCLMEFRRRLSILRDTPFTKFFQNRVHGTDSFLKWWLVTPTDKWWSFSSDDAQVATALGSVKELLLTRGLDWLDRNSDVALLKAAHERRVTS